MNIINFSHPLTEAQLEEIRRAEKLQSIEDITVHDVKTHLDQGAMIMPQMRDLLRQIKWEGFAPYDPDTIFNPPGLSSAAVALTLILIDEYRVMPKFLRLKPAQGLARTFEFAEIIEVVYF